MNAAGEDGHGTEEIVPAAAMHLLVQENIGKRLGRNAPGQQDLGAENAVEGRGGDAVREVIALLLFRIAQLVPGAEIEDGCRQHKAAGHDQPDQGQGLHKPREHIGLIGHGIIAPRQGDGIHDAEKFRPAHSHPSCAQPLQKAHDAQRAVEPQRQHQPQKGQHPQAVDEAPGQSFDPSQQQHQKAQQTAVEAHVQDPVENVTFHSRQ